jgi:hypothetical protein
MPISRNWGAMMFSQWWGLLSQPSTTDSGVAWPAAMFSPTDFQL